MRRLLACVIVATLGGGFGCVSAETRNLWQQKASREMICTVGEQCDVMWSTAIAWISRNSSFRFQQQTDLLASTFCGDSSSAAPCYEVTKQLLGGGRARIEARVGCNNIFGCTPDALQMKGQLVEAVLQASAAAAGSTAK